MIEITQANIKREENKRVKNKKKASAVGRKQETFAAELDSTVKFAVDGTIEELLTDLRDQERRFLDTQSFYEMNKYKAIVQKILRLALDEGSETKTLPRRRRDRADFTILEIINSKLLDISSAITKSNKAFNLMKTIEEIRGLVFDLVH
ncbi:MAG: YaaR family protein [bacterium]|nr:YaaR family protein [bacterium]